MHGWNLPQWLAENIGRKNRHFGTIAQLCRPVSSQPRHVSTIGKKLLNVDTSSTRPHNMVSFGLLTAEICWRVWGTPAHFNGFRVLAALLHGTPVLGVSQTLRRWMWRLPCRIWAPVFGSAAVTLGIGPHCVVLCSCIDLCFHDMYVMSVKWGCGCIPDIPPKSATVWKDSLWNCEGCSKL